MMDSIILYGKPVGFLVICCHTSLSWEGKVWKMAKSNYTDASLMPLPCVFSCSSLLTEEKKNLLPTAIFHGGDEECRHAGCSPALLGVLIASSLTRQLYFSWRWTRALGKGPGQLYSSHRWSSSSLIRVCGDDIIWTWMAGTSTSPCKHIRRETVAPLFSSQPTWVADSLLIDIIILNVSKLCRAR